jgi:2-keto-3-deoxy-L-fuconate dehydrogenase
MIQRCSGKILPIGCASALRGMKRTSTYSATRGAQLVYIQAVGVEVAAYNVQVNAIVKHFVNNSNYFPPEVQAPQRFQERLKLEVSLGRHVGARAAPLLQRPVLSNVMCKGEVNETNPQARNRVFVHIPRS